MIRPVRAVDPALKPATPDARRGQRGPREPIDELRAALAMLTRLPVPGSPTTQTGVRAYAIVGGLLGLAAFVPLVVLGTAVPVAAAILGVATLAILSGGLHLDGLADTFDALVAMGPDAAERARQDPAVGAAGATALIVVLGLQVAALVELLATRDVAIAAFACVAAGVVSRVVPVVLARIRATAAPQTGLGGWFVRRLTSVDVAAAVAIGLVIVIASASAVGRPELALGGVLGGVGSVGLGVGLVRVRGQLDGDLLGASVELGVATTLLTVVVAAGVPS